MVQTVFRTLPETRHLELKAMNKSDEQGLQVSPLTYTKRENIKLVVQIQGFADFTSLPTYLPLNVVQNNLLTPTSPQFFM